MFKAFTVKNGLNFINKKKKLNDKMKEKTEKNKKKKMKTVSD